MKPGLHIAIALPMLLSASIAHSAPAPATTPATSAVPSTPATQQQPAFNPKIMMLRWFVADIDRATKFYQDVFGMTAGQRMGDKVRIMSFPGGSMPGLILIQSPEETRMNGSFIILVADVKATLAKASAAGGSLMNTKFGQKIDGVQASSSHFIDPDGNIIEVLQMSAPKR